jgi:hypothetical protein
MTVTQTKSAEQSMATSRSARDGAISNTTMPPIRGLFRTSACRARKNSRERFRNYRGVVNDCEEWFSWEKTTKSPVATVYTNCETAEPFRNHCGVITTAWSGFHG